MRCSSFHPNGYPKALVKWVLARTLPTKPTEEDEDDDHTEEPKQLYLSYVKGVSEKIESECCQTRIQVVYRSGNKLAVLGESHNSCRWWQEKRHCVWSSLWECNKAYIGETGRNLKEGMKENKYAVKNSNMNNGIVAHVWEQKHDIDWDLVRVMCSEQHLWKKKFLQAIHIQWTWSTSNLACGLQLNYAWFPLINKQW